MTDQYLLCRAPDGSLLHIAQILGDGIELQDRVISLEKFQELLGKMTAVGRFFKFALFLSRQDI